MGIFWVNLLEVNADFVMLFEVAKSANIFPSRRAKNPLHQKQQQIRRDNRTEPRDAYYARVIFFLGN